MYEQFYGLTDKPFALTPNPKYVFYSRQYREAEGQLLYGINSREGFMLLTGKPGTGKTTLCRDLIEKLDKGKVHSALLFNPFLNGVEMLAALLTEFGITAPPNGTRKDLLDRLNQFLLAQLVLGKSCVAIFDEAQHLSHEFLEQIRVLSNLETDQEKLIQIVLVGQPELLEKIRTPQMAQLDQRVSIRCALSDLDQQETDRYIHHRLNVAGARGQVRFSPQALSEIYRASHGVPRLVNLICDRALLAGYAAQTRDIGPQHVRQSVMALRGEEKEITQPGPEAASPKRGGRRALLAAGIVAIAAVITAAVAYLPGKLRSADPESLYWSGSMATSPEQGERDLKTLITDFPQSPRVNDALLRLAQIEMGKGDRQSALQNLGTLTQRTQAAGGAAYAKAELYSARIQIEAGDTTAACQGVTGELSNAVIGDAVLSDEYTQMNTLCTARTTLPSGGATDSSAAAAAAAPTSTQAGKPRTDSAAAKPKGAKPDSVTR